MKKIIIIEILLFITFGYIAAIAQDLTNEPTATIRKAQVRASVTPSEEKLTDAEAYLRILKRKLNRAWCPPNGFDKTIQVEFNVHRDGTVSDVKVTLSSGSNFIDKTALKAIEKATPFMNLPDEMKDPYQIVCNFNVALFNAKGMGIFNRFHR